MVGRDPFGQKSLLGSLVRVGTGGFFVDGVVALTDDARNDLIEQVHGYSF
jgi:hypothetical protein